MRVVYHSLLAISLTFALFAVPAYARDASPTFKNSGMVKYTRKNYAGAVSDFNKYLAANPADADIILLRGLSKSLLKPEDVTGACADFLVVKNVLRDMNVEKYCENQPGW